ncbi:hypothetical protein AUJ95_01375 [Candidatus Desantisbacteria bacterium CG2_30_40_21]|uniref:UspA domain-containing protein n=5 Tax=unclassified Candidatus Desantisiibacteriota TaxID=3106372 RepID=A0A2M7JD05_9BACT|nr:MAG: hypothetical protein AUJ95_01375 [Candidatus Desantisbacteria bacterium CG2_30_40_21]PIP41490.1 MAG: hypothetical protein COX18_03175 [Candidatus Desantisbacteria bacterium CG23_combo_of_CG06-09_8_20_14_all_40_23]PIX17266.1 MAG: hypothetical protein COZ71_04245 [Candidatus Desantisbacteria bacterium CG_4_8_14_3_um_filter_40_12]PIY19898.1 MAG: hypothetical protein COZ13_02930 [Candidatus Desantisbacteria bacterium CG_4_10_14_3_um_filter_40_18]PJB29152.1 MAG: hypothetical protein CO110_07
MVKEELLFVTNATNEWDEGFSYVLELARSLKTGVAVLMIYGRQPQNTYGEMIVAAALADEGAPELAREHLLFEQAKRIKDVEDRNVRELSERCKGLAIDFTCDVRVGDAISLIHEILKKRPVISMILLSPNLLRVLDIRKMTKNITKPIVLITRQEKEG